MSYAWEKFHMAIHTLAGLGSIQERLADTVNLHLLHIEPQELPGEIRPLFTQLLAELAARGDVDQTVARLTDERALDYVDKIIAMLDSVARAERPY